MKKLLPFRLLIFLVFAVSCVSAQMTLAGKMTLSGNLTCMPNPSVGPVFSVAGGTYTSPQTVAISCPGTQSATYTLDGSTPNIASPLYASPLTISTTTTLKAICSSLVAHNSETQTSMGNIGGTGIGYKCNTQNTQTYGSLTCTAASGVTGQPTNVTLSFGSTEAITQTSTTNAQSLIPYFGTATGASVDSCTYLAQDKYIEAVGTINENEVDVQITNGTLNKEHTLGWQAEQTGTHANHWEIDSNAGTGWIATNCTTALPISTSAYTHIAVTGHWANGDTACSGNGCLYYDHQTVNGTDCDLSYLGAQPQPTTSDRSLMLNQDQIDVGSGGGTAGRNIEHNTVACSSGPPSAVSAATYTINPTGTATPVLGPYLVTGASGNTAEYPASPTLNFQYQAPSTSSLAVPIVVNNCSNSYNSQCNGSGSMSVVSMAITGPNASDFVLAGTTTGTLTAGQDISPTITFTPTTASGTSESATLTANYSGATVSSQTIALSGISQTMTMLSSSSCPTALASGTKYQLSANITCPITDFTEATNTNTYLNLAGHTITYCNAPPTITLTAYSASGTTITVTAANTLQANQIVNFTVSAGPTFLNGYSAHVLSAGLSTSQFEVTFTSSETGSGSATGSAAVLAAVVLMDGNSQSLHVYGGQIAEPTGHLCAGTTIASGYHQGSGWVINSSDGSASGSFGTQLSLLSGNLNDGGGKVLYEENGNATTALSTSVTMVNYLDNSAYDCNQVSCRAGNQDYPILVYDAVHAGPSTFEMIGGIGGTQGGISSSAPSSIWEYNTLNPGSTSFTTSNGFAIQDWSTEATVAYNQIFTNITTPCTSCRGIQIGSIVEPVTGAQIKNNYVLVTQLANDPEYGGCQGGGGYGIQLNTAGSGLDLSNNIIENNTVYATDGACAGPAFSFSNATNEFGPNQSISNHLEADLATSGSGIYPVQGMQFLAYEYSPAPNGSFVSTGDTICGDTSSLNIAFDGTSSWTATNDTYCKGKNPVSSGWLLYDYYDGLSAGNTENGSALFTLINSTFGSGVTKSLNNLSTWAANNSAAGMTGSYIIQWPYTVTVTGAVSGSPIVGATVTVTDATSVVECTATTNSSGVATCPTLSDTLYKALSGTYTATSYNPFGFSITMSGCTTNTYSESVLGLVSEGKTLGGC